MTPKERVMIALNHQKPDKIPFSLGFGVNQYAREQLAKYLKCPEQEVERLLQMSSDLRWVSPRYVGPARRNKVENNRELNIWGVERKEVFNGFDSYMEISKYPLSGMEDIVMLENYEFPNPDWFDYDDLSRQIDEACRSDDFAIIMGNANLFECSWYMVGFEDMLALLLTDPELVNRLLEKVTSFFAEYFERALIAANGRIDIAFTADDIGQQSGLLMSLPLWEEVIKPHHKKLNQMLHKFGVKVMYHTDGAVMDAIPGLMDMGIDILEALQFDAAGMDPVLMKNNWGENLCFHGGVSVQSTLPFGTPEEVHKEVKERIDILGRDGGYILAPSHAIQGGTPPENILAFFESAGRKLG